MKKNAFWFLIACSILLLLVGCGHDKNSNPPKPQHTCAYTQEIPSEEFKKEAATCTNQAVYYKSCACGKADDSTFVFGSTLEHCYINYQSNNDASCEDGTKTAFCEYNCGTKDTVVDIGSGLGHIWGADSLCERCSAIRPSEGLNFTISSDQTHYVVSGIGTCKDNHIVIPSKYNNLPVKAIADNAFYYCSYVYNFTIPDSVVSIGTNAFDYTGYYTNTENWEDNVLYIGKHLIKCNRGIGESSLCEIKNGTICIADRAFVNAFVKEIKIPNSVICIGNYVFYGNSFITEVCIPDSVTMLGESAFYQCNALLSVTLGNGIVEIKKQCFSGCYNLEEIVLSENLVLIGENAFNNCKKIEEVVLPQSLVTIETHAFSMCAGLKRINIPKNVTYIEKYAFSDCIMDSAIFENADGWLAINDQHPDGVSLSAGDLIESRRAANYLQSYTTGYMLYTWERR